MKSYGILMGIDQDLIRMIEGIKANFSGKEKKKIFIIMFIQTLSDKLRKRISF